MMKRTKILIGVIALVLVIAVAATILLIVRPWSNKDNGPTDPAGPMTEYTVEITSDSGTALQGVGVYIYTDASQQELVWFAKTDEKGIMTFTNPLSDKYVAVLKDVPTGYVAEESYPITGQHTKIVLKIGELTEENMQLIKYELGDAMLDFTVTDTEGTEYKLSDLLKKKKAVVLNFWYLECAPCRMEFPYLQEAYEQYRNQIEVLALNPVNNDEAAVAAFKKELGLTFPMAVVDAAWEQMMQLTAYPTTVVVDRFGNISLIHRSMLEDAKSFMDVFKYFTADDYQPGVIKDISELFTEEIEGSEANPIEFGGVTSFEITLEPKQFVHVDLYKAIDRYLQIKSSDCTVTYNGKEYKPSNGKVGFMVSSPDMHSPAKLIFTNTSDKKQTFTVTLSALPGTRDNPHDLTIGEFSASVNAGNDQGVYYRYTAKEDGVLTLQCLQSSVDKYGYSLYNLSSYAMRNLEADGKTDETTGKQYVSIPVKKGQTVEICISTLPDSRNNYPAGNFKFLAKFGEGEEGNEPVVEMADYSVKVEDDAGNALPGVTVFLTSIVDEADPDAKAETYTLQTNEAGLVQLQIPKTSYTVSVRIPVGYEIEKNEFVLTMDLFSVTIKLTPKTEVRADYTVAVVDPLDMPVEGVTVILGDNLFEVTDEEGKVVFDLVTGTYTGSLMLPDGYTWDQTSFTFPEDSTQVLIRLQFEEGSVNNPFFIGDTEEAYKVTVPRRKSVFCAGYLYEMTLTIMDAPDVYVIYDGTTYGADGNGVLTLSFPKAPAGMGRPVPVLLEIGNTQQQKAEYDLYFRYPVGHSMNPKKLTDLSQPVETTLPENESAGYFYSWTAPEKGKLSVLLAEEQVEKTGLVVNNITTSVQKSLWEEDTPTNPVEIEVNADDQVVIAVSALPENGNYPAHQVTMTVTFTAASEQPDPSEPESSEPSTEPSGEPESSEPSTEPSSDPESSEPAGPTPVEYEILVVKEDQQPASGVLVQIKQGDSVLTSGMTDADGYFTTELLPDNYSVNLVFSSTYSKYHYEASTAKLTAEATELTIQIVPENADTKLYGDADDIWWAPSYKVPMGSTYVNVSENEYNCTTVNNEKYCFFVFETRTSGEYYFTTSNRKAVVTFWGNMEHVPLSDMTTEDQYMRNIINVELAEDRLQSSEEVVRFRIGIKVDPDITGTILTITRSEITYDEHDAPWIDWTGTTTPKTIYDPVEAKTIAAGTIFTLPGDGSKLTFVDVTAATGAYSVEKGSDGNYHMVTAADKANNTPVDSLPVAYVMLGFDAPYKSLYEHVGGTGTGGSGLKRMFYNPDGTPMMNGDTYVKEEYTNCMIAYSLHSDPTYGVYPLNDDLIHIIQNSGEYLGWFDSSSYDYIFEDMVVNKDLAWMFAVCYIP